MTPWPTLQALPRRAPGALAALLAALVVGLAQSPDAVAQTTPPASDAASDAPADHRALDILPHAAEPDSTLPAVPLTPQIMFQYLAAEVAAQRGDFGSATGTMLSLAGQTLDPRLARRATEFALAGRSLEHALQASRLWVKTAPGSTLARQTLESLYVSSGRLADAEPLMAARLSRARAGNGTADLWRQLQATLIRYPDKAAALALAQRLAASDASNAQAWLTVASIAAAAGRGDLAIAEARRALTLDPDSEAAVVALAGHLQTSPAGKPDAQTTLEGFLARKPAAIDARFALARVLADMDKPDAARAQVDRALEQAPSNPTLLIASAQLAYQAKQLDRARALLQRYLALTPAVVRDASDAHLFLAQIAEDQGKLDEAIDWLAKVDDGEQMLAARVRQALLLGRTGHVDQARALLHDTQATSRRERVQRVAGEAQLLREAGRHADAFDVLDRALADLPGNPDLLYDQAMAAEKINRIDVMESSLKKLIQAKPEHAHAYNALGYTFADRNIRLDEAQELLTKALKLAPDDPHILDSVGWLEFRRGRFDAAVDYLQRAYAMRLEPDIAAHLGEVFWSSGRRDDALRVWREARARQPDNETLRETLTRLNVQL